MYVVIHGHCKVIIQAKDFLNAQRLMRDDMLELYALVEENISSESMLSKTD